MFGLLRQLEARETPIRVGLVGIGSIGRGMMFQAQRTSGMRCTAIAELDIDRAVTAAQRFSIPYAVVKNANEMNAAIERGLMAICDDAHLLAKSDHIDVFVEASNAILGGALHALAAIDAGKHITMMNYEADLMYGPLLMIEAEKKNLVYSVCDGDQPAVLRRLIDDVRFMGFDLVMAGNIKGFHDLYSNPTKIKPEADKRDLDARMCTSYTDGTKLGIEMAVLANGLNLRAAKPGMHGPSMTHINEVFDHFDFASLWDGTTGLVDYVLGPRPKGGVFVIGHTEHEYQQATIAWFPPEMGPGPFYVFYKPYHLGHFESMATVAEAALNHRAVLKPEYGYRTNVYAYAKRDLRAGETLDGVGGYTCYGLIDNANDAGERAGLPACLADDVRLRRDIAKDTPIAMNDVEFKPDREDLALFRRALDAARGMVPV